MTWLKHSQGARGWGRLRIEAGKKHSLILDRLYDTMKMNIYCQIPVDRATWGIPYD